MDSFHSAELFPYFVCLVGLFDAKLPLKEYYVLECYKNYFLENRASAQEYIVYTFANICQLYISLLLKNGGLYSFPLKI